MKRKTIIEYLNNKKLIEALDMIVADPDLVTHFTKDFDSLLSILKSKKNKYIRYL